MRDEVRMRKIIGGVFQSLDGVMQAPGRPEEDRAGDDSLAWYNSHKLPGIGAVEKVNCVCVAPPSQANMLAANRRGPVDWKAWAIGFASPCGRLKNLALS